MGLGLRRITKIGLIVVGVVAACTAAFIAPMLPSLNYADPAAFGEVPIPGSGTVHLPAGQIIISLDTPTVGTDNHASLPIPEQLGIKIVPPDGSAAPPVTTNIGATKRVDNDSYRRMWVVQIPKERDYVVQADGKVDGYGNPRLAFGYIGSKGHDLLVTFFVAFAVCLLAMAVSGLVSHFGREPKIKP